MTTSLALHFLRQMSYKMNLRKILRYCTKWLLGRVFVVGARAVCSAAARVLSAPGIAAKLTNRGKRKISTKRAGSAE